MNKRLLMVSLMCCALLAGSAQQSAKPKRMYSDHYYQRVALFDSLPPLHRSDYVMLGNSLIEFGANWNQWVYGKAKGHLVNRGIAGDEAMGIYARLDQILPARPKKIFLITGVNDLSHNLSPDSVATLVTTLVDKILADAPHTRLYLQSLLPINDVSFHRWTKLEGKSEDVVKINALLRAMAASRGITFIDLFPLFVIPDTHLLRPELSVDGLHLKPAGYEVWSKELRKYL